MSRARAALLDGLLTHEEFREERTRAAIRLADARAIVEGREKWRSRREGLVDALCEIAAAPERIMDLSPVALRDALRGVLGKVAVGRGGAVRFPEDCAAEVVRRISTNGAQGVPFVNRLNADGIIRAAELLRKGA